MKKKVIVTINEENGPIVDEKAPMTADQIDKLLCSMPRLYISDYNHERIKFSSFVNLLLERLLLKHNTVSEATKRLHSAAGKYRSVTDIYRICKYYYPKTTNIRLLVKCISESPLQGGWVCNTIKRRVFSCNLGKMKDQSKDEFGLTWDQFLKLKDQ